MIRLVLRVLLLAATALVLAAQTAPAGPPAPPAECRQFDFWVGSWEVTAPDGRTLGSSRVEPMAGGWGILEHWEGAAGASGKSLNAYQPGRRVWQQFWVGAGGILELSGGLNAQGAMELEGETRGRDGQVRRQRVTWTPRPDGSVEQLWQSSADAGATWTTTFAGIYRRRS
jgi:hypothetical protein